MSTKEENTTTQGIINAKPEDLSTNIPLSKVLDISAFLNAAANRVQIVDR